MLRLAETMIALRENKNEGKLGLAMAQYRSGRASRRSIPSRTTWRSIRNRAWICSPLMAMFTHAAGRPEEAARWLSTAEAKLEEAESSPPVDVNQASDWLEFRIHLDEARLIVKPPPGTAIR